MTAQHFKTKVVVQHASSGNFLGPKNLWVKCESEALLFSNTLEAIDFCLAQRVRSVDIILKFPDPNDDIRLELFRGGLPPPE